MDPNRRQFLRDATRLAAGAGLAAMPGLSLVAGDSADVQALRTSSANDTVRIGLIGCRGMGWANLKSVLTHSGVECVALCDVDQNVLAERAVELEQKTGRRAALHGDYRRLLESSDIDAVIIATPDHWHCLQMIHACEAGKDVYVEKPIANSIEECDWMVAAAQRYQRVVQVGQWQRSDPHWRSALDYLRSGQLGRIRSVKTWAVTNYGRNFPVIPDEPAPAGVDYDLWLGPAPQRPFNRNRFHGSFRYFWDYAGGLMTDWGVHMIDMALSGMDATAPVAVTATGGKHGFPDSAGETPDTMQALFDFGSFSMIWEHSLATAVGPYLRRQSGVAFAGALGTLVIDRDRWEVYPDEDDGRFLTEPLPVRTSRSGALDRHTQNFLDCIRSRKAPNCTLAMGRAAAVTAQLANISYRVGRRVLWDEETKMIVGDPGAHDLTLARYRSPWRLPDV